MILYVQIKFTSRTFYTTKITLSIVFNHHAH
nr:MAG TPA: RNA lariat debranching enzyme [Caudoviricetes sp.]